MARRLARPWRPSNISSSRRESFMAGKLTERRRYDHRGRDHEPAERRPRPRCACCRLHGVRHIFGLCGDTSLPFYDALARLDHGMTHILTRDERSAGYMADAYARVSGRVGVCEGPSGGGATYMLPGWWRRTSRRSRCSAITSDVSVAVARPLSADRARPAGAVPAAHQVEHGDRPRRRSSRRAFRAAFRAHDDRPAGRCAHRPALRRAEASRSTRPTSGRDPAHGRVSRAPRRRRTGAGRAPRRADRAPPSGR